MSAAQTWFGRSIWRWRSRYVGRYTLAKGGKPIQIGLNTPDKEIARKRLLDIALERQREDEGLIAPRALRDAAVTCLSELLAGYVADLRA